MIMTEILEEAAKNYAIDNSLIGYELMPYKGFIAGAKWQQERSYNVDQISEYATFVIECDRAQLPLLGIKDYFEIYKKK